MKRITQNRFGAAPAFVLATVFLGLVFLTGFGSACTAANGGAETVTQSRVRAPEFPSGAQWLNTTAPLTLKELRGKVVLIDFWTYCCINCIHIMPDLKRLEAKYKDELVVIGVHSAKFSTERLTDNIRQAVLRYGLEHPVVNDADMRIWNEYAVRAWPTLVLIDPAGYVVGSRSGEGIYEPFDQVIGQLVKEFDAQGKINRAPIAAISPESTRARPSLFAFPGKVLADAASQRLFIADSDHNRIVVLSLKDQSVLAIIGSGASGAQDGAYAEAQFNKPQGLALDGETLYVADTENHLIRRVDLAAGRVDTIAGTGSQAQAFNQSGPARTTALNSPWALTLLGRNLYIANAGSHQIWKLNLGDMNVGPWAGSGRENRTDGPLAEAALAQPSGLTTDGTRLFSADSEVSAIRAIGLAPGGAVKTVAGGELFEFGANDGVGLRARFQHPLGIAFSDGALYVADTYNNKIRKIDPESGRVETYLGTGMAGMQDGAGDRATFDEPGGLSIAGGKLYIADTNNQLIRVADLKTRVVSTLMPKEMEKLKPAMLAEGEVTELPAATVRPGPATLAVTLSLPQGMHLNELAPSTLTWKIGNIPVQTRENVTFPFEIDLGDVTSATPVRIDFSIYYCSAGAESLCYFKDGSLALTVSPAQGATDRTTVSIDPDRK